MGGTHRRITVIIRVVCQNIDVGRIPSMIGIFFFRIPPGMFSGNHPGIQAFKKFSSLLHRSSGRFDDNPVTFMDTLFASRLRVNFMRYRAVAIASTIIRVS